MKSDVKVGDVFNGYELVEKNKTSAKWCVRCLKCGFVYPSVPIWKIKHQLTLNCKHTIIRGHWISGRLESIYAGMMSRCHNVNDKSYRFYGAKGIAVCSQWKNNPNSFNEWAVLSGYANGLSIDRIDEAKGYSPDNCRWIPFRENSKWKSTTRHIVVDGVTDSGRGWAKRLSLSINYINRYIRTHGYSSCVLFIRQRLAVQ